MPSLGKQLMLKELVAAMKAQNYIFFARYESLKVSDFGTLRRKLEKVSERSIVVKNSIARRAFEKLGIKDVNALIKGSVLLTLSESEPQLASQVLVNFAKDQKNFKISGACLNGELCDTQYLEGLARLPSKEVLIATVVNGLNAPISGFVNVLGQLNRSLAVVLNQICQQKGT